jgi:LysM repeat protein
MQLKRKLVLSLLTASLMILLASCETTAPTSTPAPSRTGALTPYHTPTASNTPAQPTRLAAATIPVTPTPTATPFLHTIKKDETMLGIALTYGIQLQDLLAANPEVDPHFMSIGVTLTVPITGEAFTAAPVITPVPLTLETPLCYRSADGGAWCFALASNDRQTAVENVSAVMGLFSENGKNITAQQAIPPLNRIGPGEALPLAVFFPGPLPDDFSAQVELVSAIDVNGSQGRYIDAEITDEEVQISSDGLQAGVTGNIEISTGEELTTTLPVRLIWVAAVAYDQDGNVAGMRKWESESIEGCAPPSATPEPTVTPEPGLPLPDTCFHFDFSVFSLGPGIARVEIFTEVRP